MVLILSLQGFSELYCDERVVHSLMSAANHHSITFSEYANTPITPIQKIQKISLKDTKLNCRRGKSSSCTAGGKTDLQYVICTCF